MTELYSNTNLTQKQIETRDACLNDFYTYIKVVASHIQLGHCHEDLARFFQKEGTHKLVIYPRAHLKSTVLALFAAWLIAKNPAITILNASATATLAEAQLYSIKNILDSKIHRRLFPELLGDIKEGEREKWTQTAINVEHPHRKKLGIRDNTVYTAGAGKNIVGLHFDYLMLDDIIAPDTVLDPFTVIGRDKADRWVSLAASVLNPGGGIIGVGTRYHPQDLYGTLKNMTLSIFDDDGNIVDEEHVYQTIEEVVEVDGDFLWPRKMSKDGKSFGFDDMVLHKIKTQYIDTSQFYAQYYNDPTDPDNKLIDPDNFQYYDKTQLSSIGRRWYLNETELDIYAGLDIAASMEKRADFTALVIVGVDSKGFRYILDIVRKKTDKISVMSDMVFNAFVKWRFRKLRIETNATQGLIANQIEADLRSRNAIFTYDKQISRTKKRPRIMSILEPLYNSKSIYHYRGGQTELLEDELVSTRSPHDDIADALAMTCEIIPLRVKRRGNKDKKSNVIIHPKWGGVRAV